MAMDFFSSAGQTGTVMKEKLLRRAALRSSRREKHLAAEKAGPVTMGIFQKQGV